MDKLVKSELQLIKSTTQTKPRRRRIRSELDRLLSDEGTRNLLKTLNKPKQNKNKKLFARGSSSNKRVVLGKSRVFRENNKHGKKTEGKQNGGGGSRSGSPVKETVVDGRYVSVNTRSGVGFVTVLGTQLKEEENEKLCCEGAWGMKVLNSVECALRTLDNDSSVHVVVVQSSHSRFFCNGLDLNDLKIMDGNRSVLSNVVKAIKNLITQLNSMRKLTVASVSGDCVGFGVMVLPLFDFVYANDKSMFRLNYNALGQNAEGIGMMQNLLRGNGVGFSKLSNLLYLNTPLTATEALQAGLLSEILWPARYQEELACRLSALASNSCLISKTKSTIKTYNKLKITDLWGEFTAIETQWGSSSFQDNLKNHESL